MQRSNERVLLEPEGPCLKAHGPVQDVVRHAEDWSGQSNGDDRQAGPPEAAHGGRVGVVADGDVTEDGQCHRQPHRHRVRSDCEVRIEEQVDDPGSRVRMRGVRHGQAVEIDGVRQVDRHRQQVGNGQCRQQVVGR